MDTTNPEAATQADDPFLDGREAPLELVRPQVQSSCVVFSSPHSGHIYPQPFVGASRLDPVRLRGSEDAFIDEIYSSAPGAGSPLLLARFPRAYVDPNREPWELDPDMFTGPLPGFANTSSPRVRAGLGTIARVVTNGENIYRDKIDFSETEQRISKCYVPYHAALAGILDETFDKFGAYLLIDCHSMPSIGGPMDSDSGSNRVDIVLGDVHSTSCSGNVSSYVYDTLKNAGLNVVMNKPYAGGFTTRNYGRPFENRHALQIEINRALYMDEEKVEKTPGFDDIKKAIDTLIRNLSADAPGLLGVAKTGAKSPAEEITVRACQAGDIAAIRNIYAHHVEKSVASFEETAPDEQEMASRRDAILAKNHPYIVAEANGKVVGFAYATTFRPRSAYRHTVENSVYVAPDATGRGIGSRLLGALIDESTRLGFRQMVAVIGGGENKASIRLHERFGFSRAGTLGAAGFKFGDWVDTIFMQRPLGPGNTTLP